MGIYSTHYLTPLGEVLVASTSQGICFLEFTDVACLEKEYATLLKWLHQKSPYQDREEQVALRQAQQHILQLERELEAYFAGELSQFTVALDLYGTVFQQQVWQALLAIPYGNTCSYQEIAERIQRPTAMRAVAAANGQNPISILVPCHRVIGKNGRLVGYSGGLWRKERLLALEAPSIFNMG